MAKNPLHLSRRDFLKTSAASLAALALPLGQHRLLPTATSAPHLAFSRLPPQMQAVLAKVPPLSINQRGLLDLMEPDGTTLGSAPLLRTQWNLERATYYERLDTSLPWGIVLHWFGDLPEHNLTVAGYLRGFDGIRPAGNSNGRTSAHFLVGDARPAPFVRPEARTFGIVQTQLPDSDGIPFAASHMMGLSDSTLPSDSYFAAAFARLSAEGKGVPNLLTTPEAWRKEDWNYHTLGIEATGSYYELPGNWPDDQQIANLVGLLAALMRRYRIAAENIFGHTELDPDKSDPGKIFMLVLRALLGAYALATPDPLLKTLTFGAWQKLHPDPELAVQAYFTALRDYLLIIARPDQVYAWETLSGCSLLLRNLQGLPAPTDQRLQPPLLLPTHLSGDVFLVPHHHEGVDLHIPSAVAGESLPVQLAAAGECLFVGDEPGYCPGKAAVFRHLQPDGAHFLTVYAHLTGTADLSAGHTYPAAAPVGHVLRATSSHSAYLHFAIAYGASWEADLHTHTTPLLTTTRQHLLTRYLDPLPFLEQPLPSCTPAVPAAQSPRPDRIRLE